METLPAGDKDVQMTHDLKMDLVLELKARTLTHTNSDSIWALDSGRRPKEILASSSSRGESWKRNSFGGREDGWRSSLLNGNSKGDILYGNLSINNRRQGSVGSSSSVSSPDSPEQQTNRRSFTLLSTSRSGSGTRSSRLSPRLSSSTSSLTRPRSSEHSAPPLIPPPKSFLQRQASLTSSTSSISSLKQFTLPQNVVPTPIPSPPTPLESSYQSDSSSLSHIPPPPPPESEDTKAVGDITLRSTSSSSTEVSSPSLSRSSMSTASSTSTPRLDRKIHDTTPPPSSPPSPPPSSPPSPPPYQPQALNISTSYDVSSEPRDLQERLTYDLTSSSHLQLPHDDEDRKSSISPSEVLGLFDQALEDQALSVSSYNDTPYENTADVFSPTFKFSGLSDDLGQDHFNAEEEPYHETFEFAYEARSTFSPIETSATEIFSEHNRDVQCESKINLSLIEHADDGETFKDRSNSDRDIEINELSPTSKEVRKRRPQSFVVTKLRPDVKTVRQQIKPGTVEDLASLFANMKHQYVTSPTKDKDEIRLNLKEKLIEMGGSGESSGSGSHLPSPRDQPPSSKPSPRQKSTSSDGSSSSDDDESDNHLYVNVNGNFRSEHNNVINGGIGLDKKNAEFDVQEMMSDENTSPRSRSSSESSLHRASDIKHTGAKRDYADDILLTRSLSPQLDQIYDDIKSLSVGSKSSSEGSLNKVQIEQVKSSISKSSSKESLNKDETNHESVTVKSQPDSKKPVTLGNFLKQRLSISSSSSEDEDVQDTNLLVKQTDVTTAPLSRSSRDESSPEHQKLKHNEKKLSIGRKSSSEESLHQKGKSILISEENLHQNIIGKSSSEENLREFNSDRKLSIKSRSSSEESLHQKGKSILISEENLYQNIIGKSSSEENLQREFNSDRKLSIKSRSSSEESLHQKIKSKSSSEESLHQKIKSKSSSEESLHQKGKSILISEENLYQNIIGKSSSEENLQREFNSDRKLSIKSRSSSEESLHQKIKSKSSSEESLHQKIKSRSSLEESLPQKIKSRSSSEESLHQKIKSRSSSEESVHQESRTEKKVSSSSESDNEQNISRSSLSASQRQDVVSSVHIIMSHDSEPQLNTTSLSTAGLHSFSSDNHLPTTADAKPSFDFLSATREIMKQITSRGGSRNSSFSDKDKASKHDDTTRDDTHTEIAASMETELSERLTDEMKQSKNSTTSEWVKGEVKAENSSNYVNVDLGQHTSKHTAYTHSSGKNGPQVILDLPSNHLSTIYSPSSQHDEKENRAKDLVLQGRESKEIEQKGRIAYELNTGAVESRSDRDIDKFSHTDNALVAAEVTTDNSGYISQAHGNRNYENIKLGLTPSHIGLDLDEIGGLAGKSGTAGLDLPSQLAKVRKSMRPRSNSSSSSSSSSSKSETPVTGDGLNASFSETAMIDSRREMEPAQGSRPGSFNLETKQSNDAMDVRTVSPEIKHDDHVTTFISGLIDFVKDDNDTDSSSSSSSGDDENEREEKEKITATMSHASDAQVGAAVHVTGHIPPQGDYLLGQAGETLQAGLFAHEMSNVHETRGWGGEVIETEARKAVEIYSASGPPASKFTSDILTATHSRDEITSEKQDVDSDSNEESLLSILNNISVNADLNSDFKNTAVHTHSRDKFDSSDSSDSDSDDSKHSDTKEKSITQENVITEDNKSSIDTSHHSPEVSVTGVSAHFELVNSATSETDQGSHHSNQQPLTLRLPKSDIDEAIWQQHQQLSSPTGQVLSHEPRSARSSVSSLKSDQLTETKFNSSFFKNSHSPLVNKKIDQPSKSATNTETADSSRESGPVLWATHDQVSSFLNQIGKENKKSISTSSSSSASSKKHIIQNVREEAKRISLSSSSASSSVPSTPHKPKTDTSTQDSLADITLKTNVLDPVSETSLVYDKASPARASVLKQKSLTRTSSHSPEREEHSKILDEGELLTKDKFKALRQAFENQESEEKNKSTSDSFQSKEHRPIIRNNSLHQRLTPDKFTEPLSLESRPPQKLLPDLFRGLKGGKTGFPNYFAGDVENNQADPFHSYDGHDIGSPVNRSKEDSESDSDTSASSKEDTIENLKRKLSGQRNKQIRYSYDLQTGEARRESLSKKISVARTSSTDSGSKHRSEEVFLPSHHDDSTSSSESDGETKPLKSHPTKAASETSKSAARHRSSSSSSSSDNGETMTAIVGELSTFGIHKRVTTQEETFSSVPVVNSSTALTNGQLTAGLGQNSSDIYLIQDHKGDYYALQEVQENQGKTEENNIDAHLISANVDSSSGFHGFPLNNKSSDLVVDSSDIDDDKAREVIDAFLDSQMYTATRSSVFSHTSSSLSRDDSKHASERDTEWRTASWHETPKLDVSRPSHGSLVVHQTGHVSEGLNNNTFISADNSALPVYSHGAAASLHQQYQSLHGYGQLTSGHDSGLYTSSWSDQSTPSQYVVVSPNSAQLQNHSFLVNQGYSTLSPYATTPITVTTTTQAVVGEKVDMKIDFSPVRMTEETIMAPPETLHISHSDNEGQGKQYIVKSVPNKSSLKKTSQYNTDYNSDTGNDIIYTKTDTLTADVRLGGQNHEIILRPYEDMTGHPVSYTTNDNYAPASHNGPLYQVRTRPSEHFETEHTTQHAVRPRSTHDSYYNTNNATREPSELYRVRSLSTSVPDALYVTETTRGRQTNRAPSLSEDNKSYRITESHKKHHSPERYFKNAQFSLRKDDYDGKKIYQGAESDSEAKTYRTVTKVYVNGDKNRSRSPSPPLTKYKVSNLQSHDSFNKKADKTYKSQSYYVVNTNPSNRDSSDSSDSESDFKKNKKRYRVFGKSDSALNFSENKTFSTPSNFHNRSFDDAQIVTTKTINPSRLQNLPPTTNTHRTIIQLEVDRDKKIKETQKVEADFVNSRYVIRQTASDAEPRSRAQYRVSSPQSSGEGEHALWRTGRAKSMDSVRHVEGLSHEPTTSPRSRTFQQKDGNRMYVVNSTLSDPNGWYKSTIDINENHPEQRNKNIYPDDALYTVRNRTSGLNTSSDFETGTTLYKVQRAEKNYVVSTEPQVPEHLKSTESLSNDLRVLRGKILIQNRLDGSEHTDDDFDENANLFDTSFHLGKDNPLYSSDPDLMASLAREEQQEMSRQVNQDITFETVDKIAHKFKSAKGQVDLSPQPNRKQNLSAMLLSKLANVDSKDIRQTIDVEHHSEDIFGDIDFIHADGQRSGSRNTANFDSVNEKVELTLTQGKAFVIIKVIAERIVPTDYEFNVWRKSQAIVTRQIEIDLLANEQRRRLYQHVMDSAGHAGYLDDGSSRSKNDPHGLSNQERQLSSMETLKLFSQILDVTDGQGDKEHTDMRTKQSMGQLPAADSDLLY